MLIQRLAHICIGSYNLEESLDFYTRVLGMRKVFDFIKNGEMFGFYLDAGDNTYLEVFHHAAKEEAKRPLLEHICFEVEDIDTIIAELDAKSWEIIAPKKRGGDNSYQVWVADPSGVRIEFMQYTPESSQLTGNPCIVDW